MKMTLILALFALAIRSQAQTQTAGTLYPKPVDMKLLVLSGDGSESSFAAIQLFLNYMGIPYDKVMLGKEPMPELSNGNKGLYQGIILATGALAYQDNGGWKAALTVDNWSKLDSYCRDYRVRLASFYTFPEARFGMQMTDAVNSPTTIEMLPAAGSIFPYLNLDNPIKLSAAYTYLAQPVAAAGETTIPLMQVNGSTTGVLHTKADGREYLALTMDHNSSLLHSMALYYGIFNWVTKGVFIGERRIYFTPQNDDLYLPNRLFVLSIEACRPTTFVVDQSTPAMAQCPLLRLTGDDLRSLVDWQKTWNSNPQLKDFRLTMAYNGYGSTAKSGAKPDDSLVVESLRNLDIFYWLSHTYDHKNLDCYVQATDGTCRPANYDEATFEITENQKIADQLGIPSDKLSLITPGVSGLLVRDFLDAAADQGIRYLVSDTSHPEWIPPIPNTGMWSDLHPEVFIVPRRATSLFFNAASGTEGAEGSEPDEYNAFYGPDGLFRVGGKPDGPSFFETVQTYDAILDRESNNLLTYMLRGEIYPSMFHQSNFWRYDGVHSLFTELVDRTFAKFISISNLPVLSLPQSEIGKRMEERLAREVSPVQATLNPSNRITLWSEKALTVPVTGICPVECDVYGGQKIARVQLEAGVVIDVPVN
jgi:hypothetical protein